MAYNIFERLEVMIIIKFGDMEMSLQLIGYLKNEGELMGSCRATFYFLHILIFTYFFFTILNFISPFLLLQGLIEAVKKKRKKVSKR